MPRFPSQTSSMAYSFGPGPLTPAVKYLIIVNVAAFLVTTFWRTPILYLGLVPSAVWQDLYVWQPVTYMFLHAGFFHVAFNMLTLWMFGVELEQRWGTRFFVKYYAITGIGAGLVTMAVALFSSRVMDTVTIGASGAIFGLLLAYGLYFPHRQILMFFLFPVPARIFVMIVGAMALYAAVTASSGGVAHAAHLGGLVIGYIYLKSGRARFHPVAEIKYRYLKWKINRVRKKFDVYSGGRADDVNRRVH